jgi:hypothetical protein
MKNLRLSTSVFGVLAALVVATGCTDSAPDSTLRVQNRSDFWITEMHVTSVGSSTWGPNLLDGDGLAPGESLVLGIDCGTYDALLIDEDGVDCQINDIDLCLDDADWIIHNNTCGVFGAAQAARDAASKTSPAGATNTVNVGPR